MLITAFTPGVWFVFYFRTQLQFQNLYSVELGGKITDYKLECCDLFQGTTAALAWKGYENVRVAKI